MRRILDRPRPTAYPGKPVTNSPGRRVILSTGRGDVRLSAAEAVALARELLAVAARDAPAPSRPPG